MSKIISLILTIVTISCGCVFTSYAGKEDQQEKHVAPMFKTISGKSSTDNLEDIVSKSYPELFTGREKLDKTVITGCRELAFGKREVVWFGEHNPVIIPLVLKFQSYLETYLKQNSNHVATKNFIKEINCHLDMEDVNGAWYFTLLLRHAASISTVDSDEIDVFSHALYPGYLLGLLKDNAWKKPLSAFLRLDDVDHMGRIFDDNNHFPLQHASYEVLTTIKGRLESLLPAQIRYPIPGYGKFGICFLIHACLEDVYLLGIPTSRLTAHGVKVSPFAFAAHDLVHLELDPRRRALMKNVLSKLDKFVGEGGSASSFIDNYLPVAVKKYMALNNLLLAIYDHGMRNLYKSGKQEYQKFMVGFFHAIHETPNFPPEIYDCNNLDEVLSIIFDDVGPAIGLALEIEPVVELEEWDNSFDPLETSPIQGSSKKSDDEVLQWVFDNLTRKQAVQYYGYTPWDSDVKLDQEPLHSKRVTRSKRFIDVNLELKTGEKLTFTFPTLYHKWCNMDDNLGLLNCAGVELKKPNLNLSNNPREDAQKMLEQVNAEVNNLKQFCIKVAKDKTDSFQKEVDELTQQQPAASENESNKSINNNNRVIKPVAKIEQSNPAKKRENNKPRALPPIPYTNKSPAKSPLAPKPNSKLNGFVVNQLQAIQTPVVPNQNARSNVAKLRSMFEKKSG